MRRFCAQKAPVAFSNMDTLPYRSGQMEDRSRSISKRGSSALRRVLFPVMSIILRCAPAGGPVYQLMGKEPGTGHTAST